MDRHANLFQALTEFYTVLVQLAIVLTYLLRFPDPISGIDGFDANAAAALQAGFSPEAVKLMARLPYLDVESSEEGEDWFHQEGDIEIMPSTYPLTFTTSDEPDVAHYQCLREMDDEPDNAEYLIPGTCIRLSTQNVYGITWIYDTETCLLREWTSFDAEPEVRGLDHAPAKLPTEILGAWTEKYRKLLFIGFLGQIDFYPDEDWRRREEIPERNLGGWQASHDLRMAKLRLRDMYFECGWDIESKTQESFDRKRFVEMRDPFRDGVLKPLKKRWLKTFNRDVSIEALLLETPEELRQWTVTDDGGLRESDEL